MDDRSELERCFDALYVAVRDSATVDRQAAFDIAMNELDYFPLHAEARELAEASSPRPARVLRRAAESSRARSSRCRTRPAGQPSRCPGPPRTGRRNSVPAPTCRPSTYHAPTTLLRFPAGAEILGLDAVVVSFVIPDDRW